MESKILKGLLVGGCAFAGRTAGVAAFSVLYGREAAQHEERLEVEKDLQPGQVKLAAFLNPADWSDHNKLDLFAGLSGLWIGSYLSRKAKDGD